MSVWVGWIKHGPIHVQIMWMYVCVHAHTHVCAWSDFPTFLSPPSASTHIPCLMLYQALLTAKSLRTQAYRFLKTIEGLQRFLPGVWVLTSPPMPCTPGRVPAPSSAGCFIIAFNFTNLIDEKIVSYLDLYFFHYS